MRRSLFIILISIFACTEPPNTKYSDTQLSDAISDMLVAEAALNRVTGGMRDSLKQLYYDQIFEIHEMDSASFANDLKIIGDQVERSLKIYKSAEAKLDTLKNDQQKK